MLVQSSVFAIDTIRAVDSMAHHCLAYVAEGRICFAKVALAEAVGLTTTRCTCARDDRASARANFHNERASQGCVS